MENSGSKGAFSSCFWFKVRIHLICYPLPLLDLIEVRCDILVHLNCASCGLGIKQCLHRILQAEYFEEMHK